MNFTRRLVMKGAAVAAASFATETACAAAPGSAETGGRTVQQIASDEAVWRPIVAQYDVTPDIVNFENGYWGLMAKPVLEAFIRNTEKVNRNNSWYARRDYYADIQPIHARIADFLGAGADEIVFTRNATESLQALVGGYNRLKPGDAVMYSDLDYDSIQTAMDTKAEREGASVVRIDIPEPVTYDQLIDTYRQALAANPKVRLLLLTHISHRTGLMIPVREIVEIAHGFGVDCIVDAAHSWGQTDFRMEDLGADFVGFNLHKWIGAPIGAGLIYIRQDRLADISPDMSERPEGVGTIYHRIHTGTTNFATFLTLKDALDFHELVGPAQKAARVAYLRNLWAEEMRGDDRIEILTPSDPRLHAAITSFRFKGKTSVDDNKAIVKALVEKHGIFAVHRDGVHKGACVRVTPSLYNTPDQCFQLVRALQSLLAET
ncbi:MULTISPECIES: aminotransferase class V-fold PLP-dependent enzyme [Hyphomonas]|uniref:Aminotransferase n=1 Tax=Hyphomonas adhaerens TaxID=81029 RepID=A0A3B9H0W3_9PROT|nr:MULTISPECIES: aminotransferase class V-fold PLP-dependent enzyme [Hyphomonas]MBB39773.1 aminotransferase [Hyphomonas sp.]MBB40021.1 aminotransferase [Hyphomonas sp.]HAE28298.1 aminotransferase [Hyphomonas adhaerens]